MDNMHRLRIAHTLLRETDLTKQEFKLTQDERDNFRYTQKQIDSLELLSREILVSNSRFKDKLALIKSLEREQERQNGMENISSDGQEITLYKKNNEFLQVFLDREVWFDIEGRDYVMNSLRVSGFKKGRNLENGIYLGKDFTGISTGALGYADTNLTSAEDQAKMQELYEWIAPQLGKRIEDLTDQEKQFTRDMYLSPEEIKKDAEYSPLVDANPEEVIPMWVDFVKKLRSTY